MIIAYTNNDEKVVETWIFLDFTTVSCYYHKQSEQSVHEGVHHIRCCFLRIQKLLHFIHAVMPPFPS